MCLDHVPFFFFPPFSSWKVPVPKLTAVEATVPVITCKHSSHSSGTRLLHCLLYRTNMCCDNALPAVPPRERGWLAQYAHKWNCFFVLAESQHHSCCMQPRRKEMSSHFVHGFSGPMACYRVGRHYSGLAVPLCGWPSYGNPPIWSTFFEMKVLFGVGRRDSGLFGRFRKKGITGRLSIISYTGSDLSRICIYLPDKWPHERG